MATMPSKSTSGKPLTGEGYAMTTYVDLDGNMWVRLASTSTAGASTTSSTALTPVAGVDLQRVVRALLTDSLGRLSGAEDDTLRGVLRALQRIEAVLSVGLNTEAAGDLAGDQPLANAN